VPALKEEPLDLHKVEGFFVALNTAGNEQCKITT